MGRILLPPRKRCRTAFLARQSDEAAAATWVAKNTVGASFLATQAI
jgi:hypothetical protein